MVISAGNRPINDSCRVPNCPCHLPSRFPAARHYKKAGAAPCWLISFVAQTSTFIFSSTFLVLTMPLLLRLDWVLLSEEERMLDEEEAEEEAAKIAEEEMDRHNALEAA